MVGAHRRRDDDFPGEEVLRLKGEGGVTSSQKVAKSRGEDGRGKERKTQKSLLIRFPGYHDLECHLRWI